jgi:hypothetical protein
MHGFDVKNPASVHSIMFWVAKGPYIVGGGPDGGAA